MAVVMEFKTEAGTVIRIDNQFCAGKSDEERAADIKRLNQTIYNLLYRQHMEQEEKRSR